MWYVKEFVLWLPEAHSEFMDRGAESVQLLDVTLCFVFSLVLITQKTMPFVSRESFMWV